MRKIKGIMMKISNILDKTFVKFIIVGVANTVFGTAIMLLFYNVFHLNYWISTASNYVFGSILSYFLNKHFTFQYKKKSGKTVLRFIINISVCYFVAYGVAKPLVIHIVSSAPQTIQDNVAMLCGMIIFVVLNYFGQRFFIFKQ